MKGPTVETIGIGIIGSGGIARGAHMPAYHAMANEGVKIVAVSDVSEEAARRNVHEGLKRLRRDYQP